MSERITFNPNQCGGRPCIRGLRVRVVDVLELVAFGMTPKKIIKQYPYLEVEDVQACLLYAARYMDHPRRARWRHRSDYAWRRKPGGRAGGLMPS